MGQSNGTWARDEFGHHGHDVDVRPVNAHHHFVGAFFDGELPTSSFVLHPAIVDTLFVHKPIDKAWRVPYKEESPVKIKVSLNDNMSASQKFVWSSQIVAWARVKHYLHPQTDRHVPAAA